MGFLVNELTSPNRAVNWTRTDAMFNLRSAALAADPQTPWREIVKQTAAERLIVDDSLPDAIDWAVDDAIRRTLWTYWRGTTA